jgi:uncharacterized membrane protein YfcA
MGAEELLASPSGLAWIGGIALVAGFAHGLSGFGFPVISTPMVALFTDVRTAVMVTLFPNIVVNILSAVAGSGWRESLQRYWYLPVVVLIGTIVGTQVVIFAPAAPLRLLLAAVIVVYLQQERFRRIDWSMIVRHPGRAGVVLGLLAGFLSGTVNVMLPPLLIYFTTLQVGQLVMTQVMNGCFLVGKVSQAAVFAAHGQFSAGVLTGIVPICGLALAGYLGGRRLQPRIKESAYRAFLRGVLWIMAAVLVVQAFA